MFELPDELLLSVLSESENSVNAHIVCKKFNTLNLLENKWWLYRPDYKNKYVITLNPSAIEHNIHDLKIINNENVNFDKIEQWKKYMKHLIVPRWMQYYNLFENLETLDIRIMYIHL